MRCQEDRRQLYCVGGRKRELVEKRPCAPQALLQQLSVALFSKRGSVLFLTKKTNGADLCFLSILLPWCWTLESEQTLILLRFSYTNFGFFESIQD